MKANKSLKKPLIDKDEYFVNMGEDELFNFWVTCYPGGSGPLSLMKNICALIEALASLRGIDIQAWPSRFEAIHD